jgi:hypothetical protein
MEIVGQSDSAAKSSANLNFAFDRATEYRIVSAEISARKTYSE